MKLANSQDILKFGIIPELVGRLPVLVALEGLDEKALLAILTDPKNALTKQYAKLFEYDGVELTFDPGALKAIAQKTMERETGARGLRSIMEEIMTDIMYKVPSDKSIRKVIITEDSVQNGAQPQLVIGEAIKTKPPRKAAI